MIDTKRSFNRGVMAVIGCLIIDISVGEFNLLSFLYPYFASYFHSFDEDITPRSMVMLPCVWLLSQIFSGLFSIKLFNQFGYRVTFACFVVIFFVGQMLSSYITNFYMFALIYGIFGGVAQGGLIILPLYCCWRYFDKKYRSIVSGIILSAYALAPIGTSIIALNIVNPNNIAPVKNGEFSYFNADVYKNVPSFIRTFGVICFVAGSIGILMIQEPYEMGDGMDDFMMEMSEDNKSHVMRLSHQNSPKVDNHSNFLKKMETLKIRKGEYEIQPLKLRDIEVFFNDRDFRKMYIIVFVGFLYPNFMLFNFKQIGLDRLTKPDQFLNIAGSVASIFNGGSRLVLGLVFQKHGFRVAGGIVMFIQITSAFTFLPLSNQNWTFAISLCYFFICYGAQLGLYPLVMHSLYKGKGALAYSLVFSGFTASCLLVSFLHHSLTKLLGLGNVMVILGIVSVLPYYYICQIEKRLEVSDALIMHSVTSNYP